MKFKATRAFEHIFYVFSLCPLSSSSAHLPKDSLFFYIYTEKRKAVSRAHDSDTNYRRLMAKNPQRFVDVLLEIDANEDKMDIDVE